MLCGSLRSPRPKGERRGDVVAGGGCVVTYSDPGWRPAVDHAVKTVTLRRPDPEEESIATRVRRFVILFAAVLLLVWLVMSSVPSGGVGTMSREAGVLIVVGVGALAWLGIQFVGRRPWRLDSIDAVRERFRSDLLMTLVLANLPVLAAMALTFTTEWIGTYLLGMVVAVALLDVAGPTLRGMADLEEKLEARDGTVDLRRAFFAPLGADHESGTQE